MATKHISDILVLKAYQIARETNQDIFKPYKYPYDYLREWTGECAKVCYCAMIRADARGLIDYGVSLRSGWITDKGEILLEQDSIGLGAILYHVTEPKNVESILINGLIAKDSMIYCSKSPDSWKTDSNVILTVNIVGMEDIRMNIFPIEETDEIIIWTDMIYKGRISIYQ